MKVASRYIKKFTATEDGLLTRHTKTNPKTMTGNIYNVHMDFSPVDCRGRIHASRIVLAGKRPDTSDTLKEAKRITNPQTKPELGI